MMAKHMFDFFVNITCVLEENAYSLLECIVFVCFLGKVYKLYN